MADNDLFISFLSEIGKDAYRLAQDRIIQKAKDLFKNDFELFKIFWNYEEKNTPVYGFRNAISWLKENHKPGKKRKGGIYFTPRDNSGIIVLHIFFLEDETPLLNGAAPHLVVKTHEIDEDLNNAFKNNTLLIIE